jgi:hypothetical protein
MLALALFSNMVNFRGHLEAQLGTRTRQVQADKHTSGQIKMIQKKSNSAPKMQSRLYTVFFGLLTHLDWYYFQDGNRAFGELVCPSATDFDQGWPNSPN